MELGSIKMETRVTKTISNKVCHNLKVARSDAAKQFPMIAVKKHGDVGFDIPAIIENKRGYIILLPFSRRLLPTGIRVELPDGYWASIEARSSTSRKNMIVPKGVIDTGYRGELFAQILNVGILPRIIRHGDRLVQMILHENNADCFNAIEVDELSKSERGETGFGSTGR